MVRSTRPLKPEPGDKFVWGAYACTKCHRVLWISPLTDVERKNSLCLRCQRRDRDSPKKFLEIPSVSDLLRVGELFTDWEERQRERCFHEVGSDKVCSLDTRSE